MSTNSDGTVSIEMVEFLPSDSVKPVEPTACSYFSSNVLFYACREGNLEWVSILIKDMHERELTPEEKTSYLCESFQAATGNQEILFLLNQAKE